MLPIITEKIMFKKIRKKKNKSTTFLSDDDVEILKIIIMLQIFIILLVYIVCVCMCECVFNDFHLIKKEHLNKVCEWHSDNYFLKEGER